MKQTFTLLLFVLSFQLSAQDWKVLPDNDHYYFRIDQGNDIEATIGYDSSSAAGADTTFHLLTTMKEWSVNWPGGPNQNCDTCYATWNISQFANKEAHVEANGDTWLNDPGSFLIQTQAALNDSWLADTVASVTAQIIENEPMSFMGITDSVKTILLSNSDTVRLSKNYGLIQFPVVGQPGSHYHLDGIQNAGIGNVLLDFWTTYNFDVGDIFEYEIELGSGNDPVLRRITRQGTITAKTVSANGYSYDVQVLEETEGYYICGNTPDWHTEYDSYNTTWNFFEADFVGLIGNSYPGQGVEFIEWDWGEGGAYSQVHNGEDTTGRKTKWAGNQFLTGWGSSNFVPLAANSDTLVLNDSDWASAIKVTEGLGTVFRAEHSLFEYYEITNLVAYYVDSLTVGTLSSMSWINSVDDRTQVLDVRTYPNPTSDFVVVELLQSFEEDMRIQVIDLSGKVVVDQVARGNRELLNVQHLAGGIYTLRVSSDEGYYQSKISVVR